MTKTRLLLLVCLCSLEHDELEEFQRKLLLEGRPIEGVYPPNEQVRREFEEYKRTRGR